MLDRSGNLAAMTQQPKVEPVTVAQLDIVNEIIAAAVLGWPMAARLKRMAVGVLTYDALDIREMEMLLARVDGVAVGVAAWDAVTALHGRAGWRGALLHGLYVHPAWQGNGSGAALQQRVAGRAADLGFDALVVKSERVSVGYFERCGYESLAADALHGIDYPYLFRFPLDRAERPGDLANRMTTP